MVDCFLKLINPLLECFAPFFFRYLLYLRTNSPISSSSESSSLLVSLSFSSCLEVLELEAFRAIDFFSTSFSMFFSFFALFSCMSRHLRCCSCSSSLPKRVVISKEFRSFASFIAVTLGCHSLFKHLKILLVATALETGLSREFNRLFQVNESLLHAFDGFTIFHVEKFEL